MCLSLLTALSESEKKKEKKIRVRAGAKSKFIEIERQLKQTSYVQLVAIDQIAFYREFDRNEVRDPAKSKDYLQKLTRKLVDEGLHYPIMLAVSKVSGKSYVYEGNHRLAALLNTGAKWVLVFVTYYFLRDTHDPFLNYIPLHDIQHQFLWVLCANIL